RERGPSATLLARTSRGDTRVVHRAEGYLQAFLRAIASLPGGALHEDGDALWTETGIAWPIFNGVVGGDPQTVARAVGELREARALVRFVCGVLACRWCAGVSRPPRLCRARRRGPGPPRPPPPAVEEAVAGFSSPELASKLSRTLGFTPTTGTAHV